MSSEVENVDEWLKSNGLRKVWADKILSQASREYPALGAALQSQKSNRSKLELIQLVHHTIQGRFPVRNRATFDDSSE